MKRRSSRRCHWWYGMLFGVFCTTCVQAQEASGVVRCATDQREALRQSDQRYRQHREEFEFKIQNYLDAQGPSARKAADEVIRIPVVVHVIHNQKDLRIGGTGNSNISDEQIRSQIAVLNEDYRRQPGTNGFNSNAVGEDAKIEFELAQYDPRGYKVNGITRTYSNITPFDPHMDGITLASIISWPTDQYLNIWVCPLDNVYLGLAQMPSTLGLEGLDERDKNQASTDGVIIDYRYFGSVQKTSVPGSISTKVYSLGRTTTHEVGHWLGLFHPWGIKDGVCGTDYCEDTPLTNNGNLQLNCSPKAVVCSGITSQVMIENYMDYSPDACLNTFTKDQVGRIHAALSVSPRRIALVNAFKEGRIEESENLVVDLFPNPVDGDFFVKVRFKEYQTFSVSIFDMKGVERRYLNFIEVWSRKVPISTTGLPPGVYICRVSTGKETVYRRLVIR